MPESNRPFEKMFEPASLGGLGVDNRLVMAPIGTRLPSEIGGVTRKLIDYYVERARGGVGTIIVEAAAIDYPLAVGSPKNLRIHDSAYMGGHNELVEAVHANGAKIICQLLHVGRNRRPFDGKQPVAPSPIPCDFFKVTPRQLTLSEIEDLVDRFIQAAIRAKTAGYDGIELHGAHGYLIAQFMSAGANHRKDRYGGDLRNRMTFPLEIIHGIRKALGPDYPILFRLSGDEFFEGGMDLEESKRVARILVDAGVDVMDVSAGTYDSLPTLIEPMSYAQGWKVYLAEGIKKAVKIPVIGVGVIRSPEFAESVLNDGKVDFVALGRALLADPYWPRKAREGREKEIISCISCNGCLGDRTARELHIRCTVNPLAGREQFKDTIAQTIKRKTVFVIGGGPAGMMAARTATMRGHQVTLYEKGNQLGGQLRLAPKPPGKEKISWFLDYLMNEIKRHDIRINLRHPVTQDDIVQGRPDAVIIATGATPLIPHIPGINSHTVCTAWDVLSGQTEVQQKVVLIAGGGTVGCETALYLADKNKEVIIVEMLDDIGWDMEAINRMDLISKIQECGVEVMVGRKLERIEPDGVVLSNKNMEEERVKADSIVLALGATPANDLPKALKGKIQEVYIVGDCQQPRKLSDAVYEGFLAATRL